MNILSIDAWNDSECNWSWNAWHKVGTINKADFEALKTARQQIAFFREEGFIGEGSQGKVTIDDDEYNLILCVKGTLEPLFAIEYGPEY